jgi:hypothetical protein
MLICVGALLGRRLGARDIVPAPPRSTSMRKPATIATIDIRTRTQHNATRGTRGGRIVASSAVRGEAGTSTTRLHSTGDINGEVLCVVAAYCVRHPFREFAHPANHGCISIEPIAGVTVPSTDLTRKAFAFVQKHNTLPSPTTAHAACSRPRHRPQNATSGQRGPGDHHNRRTHARPWLVNDARVDFPGQALRGRRRQCGPGFYTREYPGAYYFDCMGRVAAPADLGCHRNAHLAFNFPPRPSRRRGTLHRHGVRFLRAQHARWISLDEYMQIVKAYPRLDFQNELPGIMCNLCKTKPEATYDNFVGEFGKRLIDGYSEEWEKHQTIDRITQGLLEACAKIEKEHVPNQ